MNFIYNDEKYEIIIEKKNIKNMYLKVKEDLNIYITCNTFVSDKKIEKLRALFAMSKTLIICVVLLAICALLSIAFFF